MRGASDRYVWQRHADTRYRKAHVGRAVVACNTRPIHAENNRQMLDDNIVHDLIVRALQNVE